VKWYDIDFLVCASHKQYEEEEEEGNSQSMKIYIFKQGCTMQCSAVVSKNEFMNQRRRLIYIWTHPYIHVGETYPGLEGESK